MTKGTEPADMRMMGIVHGALQRDLLRVRETVVMQPHPAGRQRRALGEHVVWLMDFLQAHHTSEDEGLWPLVRLRNRDAGALLDSLEAEHARIDPAATALRAAGKRYAATTSDEGRLQLLGALDALAPVLFPHLDREVEVGMPVVSASITNAEWRSLEREHAIKPKSLRELGIEAHWLLDGIDPEGYRVVVGTVPALPRFVLLHSFRGAYRRAARERWQPDPAAKQSVAAS